MRLFYEWEQNAWRKYWKNIQVILRKTSNDNVDFFFEIYLQMSFQDFLHQINLNFLQFSWFSRGSPRIPPIFFFSWDACKGSLKFVSLQFNEQFSQLPICIFVSFLLNSPKQIYLVIFRRWLGKYMVNHFETGKAENNEDSYKH